MLLSTAISSGQYIASVTVTEWIWSTGGMIMTHTNRSTLEKNLPQCHLAHHKSYMESPGMEPQPSGWQAGDQPYTMACTQYDKGVQKSNLRASCLCWGKGKAGVRQNTAPRTPSRILLVQKCWQQLKQQVNSQYDVFDRGTMFQAPFRHNLSSEHTGPTAATYCVREHS